MRLVKVCPTCGHVNAVTSPFCLNQGCGVSLVGVDPTDPESQKPLPESTPPAESATIRCVDCGKESGQEKERCIYCDALLLGSDAKQKAKIQIELRWPWGTQILVGTLRIGRDPPAPADLAKAIRDRGYDNVSRTHAELSVCDENVCVKDLGSANGTYVDGVKIPPNKSIPLRHGSIVRFAANLAVEILMK